MNADLQLKLQSYADGELSVREAREVETTLAADAEARALLAELRYTGSALADYEAAIKIPEAREFYWTKIQRDIQRQETPELTRSAPRPWWSRFLIPAGTFAVVAIAGLFGALQLGWLAGGARSPQIETFLADSGAVTYRDEIERTTVVWLSYPAENEFANLEPDPTID